MTAAKRVAHENYIYNILGNESNGWGKFYKYVRRRKKDPDSSPPLKDERNKIILNDKTKANKFAEYFATVFGEKRDLRNCINRDSRSVFKIILKTLRKI